MNKHTQPTLREVFEKVILDCLEFDEAEDSFDGLDTEGGIDPDWIFRIRDEKVIELLTAVAERDKEIIGEDVELPKEIPSPLMEGNKWWNGLKGAMENDLRKEQRQRAKQSLE